MSEGVVRYYGTSPHVSELETVASALVFTLFDLVIAIGVVRAFPRLGSRPLTQQFASPAFLATLLAVSLLTGAAWTFADTRDWLFKVPLTGRTSRADVWDKAFQESATRQVIVTLEDGRVFSGIVRFASEGESEFALFLRPAFVEIVADGTAPALLRCAIVGGLLVPKAAIQTIAFRDPLKVVAPPCTDPQLAVSLRGSKASAGH